MASYIVLGVTTSGDVCWDASKGCPHSQESLAVRIGDELYAMASFTLLGGQLKQYRASELATAMLFFVRRALGVAPVWPAELATLTNCSFAPVTGTGREVMDLVGVYERLLLPPPAHQAATDLLAAHPPAAAVGGALSTPVAAMRTSRDRSRDQSGYASTVDAATLDAAILALTSVCLGPGTGGIASPQGPAALAAELSPDVDAKDRNKENAPFGCSSVGNGNGHGHGPMAALSMASLDNAVDSN